MSFFDRLPAILIPLLPKRPDLICKGIDILVQAYTYIPVNAFGGQNSIERR